jgi:PhnB protein
VWVTEGKGRRQPVEGKTKKENGKGLMKLNTYLNYGGNCAQALRFYEQHLGGKISQIGTYAQMPNAQAVPPEMKDAIMHARINIAGTDLMASDVPPERFQPMRSVYLALSLDSTEKAERIYGLLSDGGEIFMPMQETFFAFRFGMLRDKFGTSWMIIHERPMPGS